MGRKIPGKKHRGIKDPEKQQEERLNKIKDKINAPPSNPNDQEIPESLQRIINYKEKSKLQQTKKKSKIKKPVKRLQKIKQVIPGLQQFEGEKDNSFFYRVSQAVNTVIKEAQFENKYNVDIIHNQETGEVEDVVKRPKDEIEELMKKLRQKKASKRKKKNESKLTKAQKKGIKLKFKKEKKTLFKAEEFSKFKDDVKFGDIVHAPPTLVTPKKVAKLNEAPRPGKKDLLLKSVLSTNKEAPRIKFPTTKKVNPSKKTQSVEVDKKSKRKALPVALRRQLEKQRTEAINAYRLLKVKKNNVIV